MSDHIVADVDAGKNLESIVDSNNKYSYTYDETGIRTSKTVNGKTTYYNTKDGVILSQINGTDTLYFQYDNTGSPLGFIWDGTQYLYLTNQMGDVISITDTSGTVVANYEYDAWGKCVSTVTAQDYENTQKNNLERQIAFLNCFGLFWFCTSSDYISFSCNNLCNRLLI